MPLCRGAAHLIQIIRGFLLGNVLGESHLNITCWDRMRANYPPVVMRGKYLGCGVFLLRYFPLVKI